MQHKAWEGLRWLEFDQWRDRPFKHGIFTRHGGVSPAPFASLNLGGNVGDDAAAVRTNHERMYAALAVPAGRACTVWQVHSADVVIAQSPAQGRRWLAYADGMVTDRADTPLAMRFADCTPILLHDPVRGVIGIAHAGWRGTVQGVAAQTARLMMTAYGCRPADLQAGIGPAIGPSCYQVGEEVVAAVQAYFGTDAAALIRRNPADGSAYFDLWAANRRDLERVGVEQVEVAGICTVTAGGDWFSHRGQHGRTGRFGAVISL